MNEEEKQRVLEEKTKMEEETKQKMHSKSEFTNRIDASIKDTVVHDSKFFSRVSNISFVNTEIFEQDYKVNLKEKA